MAIEHEWSFSPVNIRDKDGHEAVVETVHWQLMTSDTESEVKNRMIGTVSLSEPGPDFTSLIPWGDEGSYEQRKAWVMSADPDLIPDTEERAQTALEEAEQDLQDNKTTVA